MPDVHAFRGLRRAALTLLPPCSAMLLGLAACGNPAPSPPAAAPIPAPPPAAHAPPSSQDIFAGLGLSDAQALRSAMMQGYLAAGLKLVEEGAPRDAAPHFLQPVAEIYEPAKAIFAARRLDFDVDKFKALSDAANAAKPTGELRRLYAAALNEARSFEPREGEFSAAGTIRLLLKQAVVAYGEGVDGGVVQNAGRYQDALGFAVVARRLIKQAATSGNAKDPSRSDEVQREADRLLNMFPSAATPENPASQGEVQAQVNRIELAFPGLE